MLLVIDTKSFSRSQWETNEQLQLLFPILQQAFVSYFWLICWPKANHFKANIVVVFIDPKVDLFSAGFVYVIIESSYIYIYISVQINKRFTQVTLPQIKLLIYISEIYKVGFDDNQLFFSFWIFLFNCFDENINSTKRWIVL